MIRSPLLAIALIASLAPAAMAYDYRVLHLIEDRHTHVAIRVSAAPEGGDGPERGRAECARVKALDRRSRNIAAAFGRMFQRSGIHVDDILTSRICRNVQAAVLLEIGPVEELPLLDPPDGPELSEEQTEALLEYIEGIDRGETALLLTHNAVIEALTGETLEIGEGIVFTLKPFGALGIRGRFGLPPE